MRATRSLLVALFAFAVVLAGCGDDDSGGSAQAYCDLIEELEAENAEPTDENLDRLLDATPNELKDDVQTLVDAFNSDDQEAAFQDEDVLEASENLTQFEDENCEGGDDSGGGEDEELEIPEESVPAEE